MQADAYKKWHAPSRNPNSVVKQGYYIIQNKEKYIGNSDLVVYRSSWEHSFCRWCDFSASIVRWSSEPIKVPYYDRVSKLEECKKYGLDPNDPKNWVIRNYHTDFYIELKKDENLIEKWFVEIKPSAKLKKPVPPNPEALLKEHKRFNLNAKEYLINEAKFAAMKAYAEKNGCKFYVFTEQTLQQLIGKFWAGNNQ